MGTPILNLDTLIDTRVSANLDVQTTLEAKQDVLDAVVDAQAVLDSVDATVANKKIELSTYTTDKKVEINDYKEQIALELVELVDEGVVEYDENALHRVEQYDTNHTDKMAAYNANDSLKMEQYNDNHIERLENINYAYADRIVQMLRTKRIMGMVDEYVAQTNEHMIPFLSTNDDSYLYYGNGVLLELGVDYTVYDNTTIELVVKANPYDVITQINARVLKDMLVVEGALFDDRIGAANGLAGLNASGQIPSSQLPSYVDDVLEVATYAALPAVGESDKIYVVVADETVDGLTSTYRWSGSTYAEITSTMSAAAVKALYESNTNTNAYTDIEKLKLAGIDQEVAVGSDVEFNSVKFTGGTGTEGTVSWNTTEQTLDIVQDGTTLQVGQELQYIVRNTSGSTIANGTFVGFAGVTSGSNRIIAAPFNTSTMTAMKLIGFATEDIANGVNGRVTNFGYVRGLDTRGTAVTGMSVGDESWSDGDVLYVHPTVAGKLTKVAPTNGIKAPVATVTNRHQTAGELFVNVIAVDQLKIDHGEAAYNKTTNIDNTSDANKPISSATQTALNTKQATIVDGGLSVNKLDIDGATDIGASLVDTDLLIVDDGANGTNRKSAMSRLWTYIKAKADVSYFRLEAPAGTRIYTSKVESDNSLSIGSYESGWVNHLLLSTTNLYYNGSKIWTEGNDGAGSGLDADKLDGLEGSSYLKNLSWTEADLNNNTEAGLYKKSYTSTNQPVGGYGQLLVQKSTSSTTISQTLHMTDTNTMYSRTYNGTAWTSWAKIWNSETAKNIDINPMLSGLINNYCTAAQLNGTASATTALNTALANNDIVYIMGGTKLYIDGYVLIPQGKAMVGITASGMQPNRTGYTSSDNAVEIRVLNTGSGKIDLNNNVRLENISIISYSNITTATTPASGFIGTGLNAPGIICSNVYLNRIGVYGFTKGIDIATNGSGTLTRGNWHITDCQFDNSIDIDSGYVYDVIYVSRCHSYPFLGNGVTGTGVGTPRTAFINCANEFNDWLQVDHCFSHSNRRMISGYFSGTVTGGGYDFEDYTTALTLGDITNYGIGSKVDVNNRGLATISGVRFNGGQVHILGLFINNDNSVSQINVSGCTHERASHSFVYAWDSDNTVGGGIINITGMITGRNVIGALVSPKYLFVAEGTSKINVCGYTACPTLTSETTGTGTITTIGRMGL